MGGNPYLLKSPVLFDSAIHLHRYAVIKHILLWDMLDVLRVYEPVIGVFVYGVDHLESLCAHQAIIAVNYDYYVVVVAEFAHPEVHVG